MLDAAAGSFELLLPSVENYTAAGEGPCVGKGVAEDETDQPWSCWPGLYSDKSEGDWYGNADSQAVDFDHSAKPGDGY